MKVLNCGSLNIDRVLHVQNFVRPGETLAAESMELLAGGKGLNQSLALARAGAKVLHYGAVGEDGIFLKELLCSGGVDVSQVKVRSNYASGQAMIQVNADGENAIVLFAGANHTLNAAEFAAAVEVMEKGDWLLLQNEVNDVADFIRKGHEHGLKIVFNPAPMSKQVKDYPLELVDILIVNEIEAAELANCLLEEDALPILRNKLPRTDLLLTLGSRGALYNGSNGKTVRTAAKNLGKAVDTTAAGDTFIGYFLAAVIQDKSIEDALKEASAAAGWCVTRYGAAPSIPKRSDIEDFLV